MQEPRGGSSNDLTQTTQTYLDCYIALELLHCSYRDYIQKVPRQERVLHQLYVLLKSAKDEYAQETLERQAALARETPQALTGRP